MMLFNTFYLITVCHPLVRWLSCSLGAEAVLPAKVVWKGWMRFLFCCVPSKAPDEN